MYESTSIEKVLLFDNTDMSQLSWKKRVLQPRMADWRGVSSVFIHVNFDKKLPSESQQNLLCRYSTSSRINFEIKKLTCTYDVATFH